MIEINLLKTLRKYDGSSQLRIDKRFETQAVTAIHGPSGSGKTSFLKMVAGLASADEGLIIVDGEVWLDTAKNIHLSPQQRKTGFVFQDYALFPAMTVQQHLNYGTGDRLFIDQLIEMGRMEPFLKHKPHQLSGGQQQRLAILRALTTRPKLLLMDEPFSAQDAALKASLISDLSSLITETGATCLVVSHYPFETDGFAQYAVAFS